jgi:hypothetical protein
MAEVLIYQGFPPFGIYSVSDYQRGCGFAAIHGRRQYHRDRPSFRNAENGHGGLVHNHGIEGKDYIMNSDGTLGYPKGYDAAKDGLDTNFWAGPQILRKGY